jgi:pSer/pThr/pTyr-binding forkhead associated (FHA) protein
MKELWLKFTDENGELKRIPVKGEKFAVGRHSENDLSVANSAISRKHVKIERFADIFMISDVGSSLGTQINGVDLTEPVALYNKDKIALGGGFEIEVEIVSDEDESAAAGGADSAKRENEETASAISAAPAASASGGGSSIPASFFFLAPIFGILVLLGAGGIFLATSSGGSQKNEPKTDEFVYSTEREAARENPPKAKETVDEVTVPESPASESLSENRVENTSETTTVTNVQETDPVAAPPKISSELEAVEINSASFLRRVAQSDPRAFLTEWQQEINLRIHPR